MSSVSTADFMLKVNFYSIPKYAKVKLVNIYNESCLIEDINTGDRICVMKYDIYPLSNYESSGYWEFSNTYEKKAIKYKLK
jgi:hypothetical protein